MTRLLRVAAYTLIAVLAYTAVRSVLNGIHEGEDR